jgi:MFS family permease
MFAGPLSDTYGRKPVMLLALFGLVIQNLVFLLNAVWFQELRVEYLLLECLQDLTGGRAAFFLAVNSYIVDVTSEETRTARFCFLEAAFCVGTMLGNPIGTKIKAAFGFVTLFSINLALSLATMLYIALYIQDSIHLVSQERRAQILEEKEKSLIKCDSGVCGQLASTLASNFTCLVRARQHRTRFWIFVAVYIAALFSRGGRVNNFMFYRRQYQIDTVTYSLLFSIWAFGALISQLFIVPFLSVKLGIGDTGIIILALTTSILGYLSEALFSQLWVLILSWSVFQLLWANVLITTMSAMSKLIASTEVGKIFCLLALGKSLMKIPSAPLFAFIYRASVSTLPSLYLYIMALILLLILALTTINHVDIKREERQQIKEENQELSIDGVPVKPCNQLESS